MKALAADDRPREKLERVGADALGDNELVALVLGTGQRNRGALEFANALLAAVGGLHRLTRSSRDALCRVPGVGAAQAARLLAAVELGRRTLLQPPADRPQLRSPRETAAYLLPRFSARPVEHFGLVLLDVRCRVIRTALLSVGTIDATTVIRARSSARPRPRVRRAWFCSIITRLATPPRAPTTCASPRASCARAR